jgi:hypothetical protein
LSLFGLDFKQITQVFIVSTFILKIGVSNFYTIIFLKTFVYKNILQKL